MVLSTTDSAPLSDAMTSPSTATSGLKLKGIPESVAMEMPSAKTYQCGYLVKLAIIYHLNDDK